MAERGRGKRLIEEGAPPQVPMCRVTVERPDVIFNGATITVVGRCRLPVCGKWGTKILAAFPDGTDLRTLYEWVDEPGALTFVLWKLGYRGLVPPTSVARTVGRNVDFFEDAGVRTDRRLCDDIRRACPLEVLLDELQVDPEVL